MVNQYCAHSFARNWQLPFLNQRKGENDRRKYFMINLHERMLPTSAGVEPATSWSPVGRRIQLSHRDRCIYLFMPSGHFYINSLDRYISSRRGVWFMFDKMWVYIMWWIFRILKALTLPLLNTTCPVLASSVESDQLASDWSEPALFAIQYLNLYQQLGSSNPIGWKVEVDVAS